MRSATLLTLIGGLSLAGPAVAADVTFKGTHESFGMREVRFRIEGQIAAGDVDQIKSALAGAGVLDDQLASQKVVVELDSRGGSYHAGLDLALLFRRLGLATEVMSGDQCFSACAVAFLGGADVLRDTIPVGDDDPLPTQRPDRRLEPGAELGFHAPYLEVRESSYTADNVAAAYTAAVLAIARLIAIADRLYVSTAELPTLLKPRRDELFMVDTVDAVGFLGIDYQVPSVRSYDDQRYTRSMITNACINRYYHLQRRSSLGGHATALSVMEEFVEGSKLLENGEEDLVFGVHRRGQGTISTWLSFTPIAKTQDGKNFVWCLFSPVVTATFYKPAGTVSELLDELKEKRDIWDFEWSETTIRFGEDNPAARNWMRDLDMVPPDTKLSDIGTRISRYLATEEVITAE